MNLVNHGLIRNNGATIPNIFSAPFVKKMNRLGKSQFAIAIPNCLNS